MTFLNIIHIIFIYLFVIISDLKSCYISSHLWVCSANLSYNILERKNLLVKNYQAVATGILPFHTNNFIYQATPGRMFVDNFQVWDIALDDKHMKSIYEQGIFS